MDQESLPRSAKQNKAQLFFFFLLLLLLLNLSSSHQICRDERQLIARKTPPLQPEFYFKKFVSETHTYNETKTLLQLHQHQHQQSRAEEEELLPICRQNNNQQQQQGCEIPNWIIFLQAIGMIFL